MENKKEPDISSDIPETELDEMWHFLQKKVKNSVSSRQWIAVAGEPLPGLQGVEMLQRSSEPKKLSFLYG